MLTNDASPPFRRKNETASYLPYADLIRELPDTQADLQKMQSRANM